MQMNAASGFKTLFFTKEFHLIVTLVMALTVDGKIGRDPGHFPDWSGKEDKKLFAAISKKAGAVIMGSKTFDTFGKPLPYRKNIILTRNRDRQSKWPNLHFTNKDPGTILKDLEAEGYSEVILAGGAWVNTLFAKANLIDNIILTISSKIFGTGLSLFTEAIDLDLELKSMDRIGENLVCLKYRVKK